MCRRFDSGPVHWKTQEASRLKAFGRVNAALRHGPGGMHRRLPICGSVKRRIAYAIAGMPKLAPVPDFPISAARWCG